jgi:hypothetical protein
MTLGFLHHTDRSTAMRFKYISKPRGCAYQGRFGKRLCQPAAPFGAPPAAPEWPRGVFFSMNRLQRAIASVESNITALDFSRHGVQPKE